MRRLLGVAGDANGDGLDDIVSFNLHQFGNRVLLSNGEGFEPEQNWGNGSFTEGAPGSEALFVADMDNDHRADSVVVRLGAPRGLYVARSETNQYGVNHFASPQLWLNNSIVGDRATLAADVDADGDTDIIGLYDGGIPVLVARSNGTASLPLATWGPPSIHGDKTSLAADGDADLIAINDTDVQVMRSTGTGFDAPELWHPSPFFGTWDTLAADVDGDGDADLAAVNGGVIRVLRTQ